MGARKRPFMRVPIMSDLETGKFSSTLYVVLVHWAALLCYCLAQFAMQSVTLLKFITDTEEFCPRDRNRLKEGNLSHIRSASTSGNTDLPVKFTLGWFYFVTGFLRIDC